MTAKKLIIALALLATATTAVLAKTPQSRNSGAQSGASDVFEDAQHGGGIATQR